MTFTPPAPEPGLGTKESGYQRVSRAAIATRMPDWAKRKERLEKMLV